MRNGAESGLEPPRLFLKAADFKSPSHFIILNKIHYLQALGEFAAFGRLDLVRVYRDSALTVFLAASAAWFMLDATLLWKNRPYSPGQMRFAMIAWNVVALLSMPWVWWKATLVSTLY